MSDFLASLGPIGFTYRMRRLSDRLQDGARRLYERLDVPLEPNWHVLLLYLERHGTTSVTDAATALRVSHPAISELARRMEAAGLVVAASDPLDGRRRVLRLSREAVRRMPRFKEIWAVAGEELATILETTSGGDALSGLSSVEGQLDEEELDSRIGRRLESDASPRSDAGRAVQTTIRGITDTDRDDVVHIARELVRAADTYAYGPDIEDDDLWRYWDPEAPGVGHVAVWEGRVAGVFVIRPNSPGPGSHVANASYAVRADVRGLGLGRRMGEASIGMAADLGYRAMQFNTVVATNRAALRLWRSLGFRIVGTIPHGFRLPDGSYAAHHIMYRELT